MGTFAKETRTSLPAGRLGLEPGFLTLKTVARVLWEVGWGRQKSSEPSDHQQEQGAALTHMVLQGAKT